MSTGCKASRHVRVALSLSFSVAMTAAAVAAPFALAAPALAAPRPSAKYQVTKIQHPDGEAVLPLAINDNGTVVGVVQFDAFERAFVAEGSSLTILPTLGGTNARAWGVNNSGDVVGEAQTAEGTTHAFIWRRATSQMVDLGSLLGTDESIAYGISDAGQVVGEMGPLYFGNAFVWSDATGVTDLGPGYAKAINASGAIAGQVRQTTDTTFIQRAAVWQNGVPTLLPTLGGDDLNHYATDINDSGTVVGASMGADLEMHGFVWRNGTLTDVGDFGGSGHSAAFGVNNQNQVVGSANYRPFLWENGSLTDLSAEIPHNSNVFLADAVGINETGHIVCHAWSLDNLWVGAVLTKGGSTPPPAGDVELSGDWTSATKKTKGSGKKLKATISSSYTIRNTGSSTVKKFVVTYYLSSTPDLSGTLLTIGSKKMGGLKSGAYKTLKYKVTLKGAVAEAAAGMYVIAVIDEANKIVETDETNNLRALQIP